MDPRNPFVDIQIAYKLLKDIKEDRDVKTKEVKEVKKIVKMDLDIEVNQDEVYIVNNIHDDSLGYSVIKKIRDELGCQNYPSVQKNLDLHLESEYYDYNLLENINLLQHSYNVAFEIIEILSVKNINPP